jgi:tyrosyl-tRNA synthetase
MQEEVASGALHPMEAKKRLARAIVTDFHSAAAAQSADENWAKQFQRGETPEDLPEVRVSAVEVGWSEEQPAVSVDKLVARCGLAASTTEASRKRAEKSVRINDEVVGGAKYPVAALPARVALRVGKRAAMAVVG